MMDDATTFVPSKYGGWPQKLYDISTGIERRLMPTKGNALALRQAADILHAALEEVTALQRALCPLPEVDPTTTTPKPIKVRNAMWELWEDRVVDLRNTNRSLLGRVRALVQANNAHREARCKAVREVKDLRKLVWGLEQVLKDLFDHPPGVTMGADEPHSGVPDLGRVAAQLRGGDDAKTDQG